tara:strand:+ start:3857 stop:5311 length:1455 start_codon:yes stop_codon:yes gene_type:complete
MNDNSLLKDTRATLYELAQEDFYLFFTLMFPEIDPSTPFSHSKHFQVLANAFEKVVTGETPKLLVALPPRFGKSVIGSIALPAWLMGIDPSVRIICGSYGEALAKGFSQRTRDLMNSPAYRAVFGEVLSKKDGALEELQTVGKGYRFTTTVNGAATGKGANIIIVDDPMKAIDAESLPVRDTCYEWVKSTLMSRFDPGGPDRMIVIMQRLHQDDLIGRLMADGGWALLEMPALIEQPVTYDLGHGETWSPIVGEPLFPEGVGLETIAERRLAMTEAAFNAQFMQRPESPQGTIFKMKLVQRYESPRPYAHKIDMIVQSWDPAVTENDVSAFSVCTTWGICGKDVYLLHVFRKRLEFPKLVPVILNLQQKYKAQHVLIETNGVGKPILQEVQRKAEDRRIFHGIGQGRYSKTERALMVLPRLEHRRVHLPVAASWLETFEHELATFPLTRYFDQVDSMVNFLMSLTGWNPITMDLPQTTNGYLPY